MKLEEFREHILRELEKPEKWVIPEQWRRNFLQHKDQTGIRIRFAGSISNPPPSQVPVYIDGAGPTCLVPTRVVQECARKIRAGISRERSAREQAHLQEFFETFSGF